LTAAELNDFAENSGILSQNVAADLEAAPGNIDASDDLGWSACGQSKDLVTPLAVCQYYSIIANHGVRKTLFLQENAKKASDVTIFSDDTANFLVNALTNGMKLIYHSPINCNCFGKSGTAQLDNAVSDAWFVCCLNSDTAPSYTVLAFIEHGGSSVNAKNLAADYINNYILR